MARTDRDRRWLAVAAQLPQSCAMACHACGRAIEVSPGEPVGFRAECEGCAADLHVCLNCVHHDPAAYNECRESNAERVRDPDRANRCDYFRLAAGAGGEAEAGAGDASRETALSELDRLFSKD